MSVTLIDKEGSQYKVELNGMQLHREAADEKLTFRQHVNSKFSTSVDEPEPFQSMCMQAGLRFERDKETGRPASTIREAMNPAGYEATDQSGGTYTSNPAIPDSRILFAPALQEAVENKLQSKENKATAAFESLVGYRETVAATRIEQPVLNYSTKGGPEDAEFSRQAQNSRANVLLSITASDISRVIPASSFALEISDEAATASLDFVTRTMARFYKLADYKEWVAQLLMILNGNPDSANTPMDNGTAAIPSFTANSLTAATLTQGIINQEAWLKFFYRNSMTMTPDKCITAWDGMYAIENRENRPSNVTDDTNGDRMDAKYRVIYPEFADEIGMVVMPEDAGWPAGTILGMESENALAKITSSSVAYNAVEAQVMKRSTEMRFDRGFILYRQYTNSFAHMTLTV